MAIKKLPDGRWRVQVDVGRTWEGRRDRRTRIVRTKVEARAVEEELLVEKAINQGRRSGMTLEYFVENIFWPMKRPTLRDNSIATYERDLRLRLLPEFGFTPLEAIEKTDIQLLLNKCPTRKTAQNARDTLRLVLNEAVEARVISGNPAAGKFRYPEAEINAGKQNGVWLTSFSEHMQVLKEAHGHVVEPIVLLGLCFGLRKGEILGLTWGDVNFETNTIRINKTYTYTSGYGMSLTPPKTSKSIRVLPMPDYAKERLGQLNAESEFTDDTHAVVSDGQGKHLSPSTATKRMRQLVRDHDIPNITIMSLRHSFATASIRAGIDIATVSMWLGHTTVSMTLDKYVRSTFDTMQSDLDIINEAHRAASS